jgi:hypothetical protein
MKNRKVYKDVTPVICVMEAQDIINRSEFPQADAVMAKFYPEPKLNKMEKEDE